METAFACLESIKSMARGWQPKSISDAGCSSLCIRTAVMGAFLNVRINCKDLNDHKFVLQILKKGRAIVEETNKVESEMLSLVDIELD